MKISIQLDRSLYGPSGGRRHLWIRLEVPRKPARNFRPPLDIALVLDRSGSMSGEKIALARKAAQGAVSLLRESDRCGLVAYDHEVLSAVPCEAVTAEQKFRLNAALAAIEARGNTNLFGGWLAGGEQVGADAGERLRRVILLTDGLANEGVTDHTEILHHVRELNLRGVGTSTFGVGLDFDEELVAGIAEAGGGHFYYVELPAQIPDYLSSELGELLTTAARSVMLGLKVSGPVKIVGLNDLPVRGALYDIGDLAEGAVINVCFALDIAPGSHAPIEIKAVVSWVDAESAESGKAADETALLPATDEAAQAESINETAIAQVAHVRAARVREQALTRNKVGNYAEAERLIEAEIAELAPMAAASPAVDKEVASLRSALRNFSAPMSSILAKQVKLASYEARRSRMRPEDE